MTEICTDSRAQSRFPSATSRFSLTAGFNYKYIENLQLLSAPTQLRKTSSALRNRRASLPSMICRICQRATELSTGSSGLTETLAYSRSRVPDQTTDSIYYRRAAAATVPTRTFMRPVPSTPTYTLPATLRLTRSSLRTAEPSASRPCE